jgi:ABC-type dipeptide/oligopeptide/nickel transport system permease component
MNHFPIILAINISTMIICERMFGLTGLFSTFIDAMISGEFLFCLGIVLSLMVYYYIVVLTSQTLSRVLMPRSGGAYEVE